MMMSGDVIDEVSSDGGLCKAKNKKRESLENVVREVSAGSKSGRKEQLSSC